MMYRDSAVVGWPSSPPRPARRTDPDWYHNVLAHPEVTAEIGTENARLLRPGSPATRSGEPIGPSQKQDYPGFADYEAKTSRQIPVVILELA